MLQRLKYYDIKKNMVILNRIHAYFRENKMWRSWYNTTIVFVWWYLKTVVVPISNKKIKLAMWFRKWSWDYDPWIDSDRAKSSTSLVEVDGGEVRKGANLVFYSEYISPTRTGSDRTVRTRHSILPWVEPLLYTIPENSIRPILLDSLSQRLYSPIWPK